MSEASVLEAVADALVAASNMLRQRAAILVADEAGVAPGPAGAVSRARAVHPMLGHRQAEVIQVLEEAGGGGTNTGVVSKRINYDQPNVYLTLRGLMTLGFVEKDAATSPHTYKLTSLLLDTRPSDSAATGSQELPAGG